MVVRFARCIGVSITGMALANVAWAQETNVTTLAKSVRLGGEFRSEFIYTDNGLTKREGYSPKATSEFAVTAANVLLQGSINDNTEYAFRFNLINTDPTQSPLDYGYGTHWFNKMVGFSVGKMTVLQGGWDNIDAGYRNHIVGAYAENLAYPRYDNMLALHLNVAGRLSLQLVNDKVVKPGVETGASWNQTAHPTWVLGWMGEFGPIKPLIDIGSYDNNKSRWIDVGIKTEMNGLMATLDYHNQSVVGKEEDPADATKTLEPTNELSAITVKVAYEMKNLMTPWVYFSTFDNKQASESKLGLKDIKYNPTPDADDLNDSSKYMFSDNGMSYGIGADFAMLGEGWNPFIALVSHSGKFLDTSKAGDETVTRSELQVKIGVLGGI